MTSMFALWASTLLAVGGPVTEVTITPMAVDDERAHLGQRGCRLP